MSQNSAYKVGDSVQWKWLGRAILGQVKKVFYKPVSQVIKGKTIKRNASPEKPAYLVESEAGNLALKLETELSKPAQKKTGPQKPKMFSEP